MNEVKPVILCGGVGTRLWPLSRKSLPKQFAPLLGDKSLFGEALARISEAKFNNPTVITASDHKFIVERQLQDYCCVGDILLEPEGKNTAPAILASAHHMIKHFGDGLLLVMPSDHHIPDHKAFAEMVNEGLNAAKNGMVVTFGVAPTRPETGYGYIELGELLKDSSYEVKKFHEKPQLAEADRMLDTGNYLWNSGIFLFKASTVLSLAEQYEPNMLANVSRAVDLAVDYDGFWHIDETSWSFVRSKSIDYAILEKIDCTRCVKFSGVWSDLGDWKAVTDLLPKDEKGNRLNNLASQINCQNSALWSTSDRLHLVGLGLENIVSVVTDDAVLVAHTEHLQDVSQVVDLLREKGIPQGKQHIKDYRPWGWFESLVNTPGYQVKRLNVYPGAALSLQSHQYRSEHWVVVYGNATVVRGNDVLLLATNESIYIEKGQKHRLVNDTDDKLTVIEVQTGDYLGEDDITRYEDVYQRR